MDVAGTAVVFPAGTTVVLPAKPNTGVNNSGILSAMVTEKHF
jgi:hypothetical protein